MQICNVLFTVDVVLVEALDILIAIPIQRKPSMDIKQDGLRSLKRDRNIGRILARELLLFARELLGPNRDPKQN